MFTPRWMVLLALGASLTLVSQVYAAPKHAHLHHALRELREADKEIRAAKHDFGGHRTAALQATDAAIVQIELMLKATQDPYQVLKVGPNAYKGYKHHPHTQHTIHVLKESAHEIKKAPHDFGGHKQQALKDIHHAIAQLELVLKHHV